MSFVHFIDSYPIGLPENVHSSWRDELCKYTTLEKKVQTPYKTVCIKDMG